MDMKDLNYNRKVKLMSIILNLGLCIVEPKDKNMTVYEVTMFDGVKLSTSDRLLRIG